MNITIRFAVASLFLTLLAQGILAQPNWRWAKSSDVQYDASGSDVVVDSVGNIYVTGYFEEPDIAFDSTSLFSQGQYDIFVAKYNSEGNVIWTKSYGGTNWDKPSKIVIDKQSNLVICGTFKSSSISFDSDTLINHGNSDVFLVKMDTSGNTIWTKNIYSLNEDGCSALDIDSNNNILISGIYNSADIFFDTLILNASGYSNFLAKYNSNGDIVWAKNFGVSIHDLCTDNNNILLTGCFDGQCTEFGDDTLESMGEGDIFIAKLDDIGAPVWAKSYGESGYDQGLVIGCSDSGIAYISGSFNSQYLVVIDTLHNLLNYSNNFIIIVDSMGQPLHATTFDFPEPVDLCVDKNDDFYIITSGEIPLSKGSAYIYKYDSNYQLIWTKLASCRSTAIEVFESGPIITTGYYSYIGFFDDIIISASNSSSTNFFLAKTDTVCGIPLYFSYNFTGICFGDSTTLSVTTGYDSYIWNTGETTATIAVSPSVNTTYSVTVTNDSCKGFASGIVRVHPTPPTPVIYMSGDTLFSNAPSGNHWYIAPSYLIPGATGVYYILQYPGYNYCVIVTDNYGCVSDASNYIFFTDVSASNNFSNSTCEIYPNPSNGTATITFSRNESEQIDLELFDMFGHVVFKQRLFNPKTVTFDTSPFPEGIYIIRATTDKREVFNLKFIISK